MASRFARVAKPILYKQGAKVRLSPRQINWFELFLVTALGVASGTYIFRDSFMQLNRNSAYPATPQADSLGEFSSSETSVGEKPTKTTQTGTFFK